MTIDDIDRLKVAFRRRALELRIDPAVGSSEYAVCLLRAWQAERQQRAAVVQWWIAPPCDAPAAQDDEPLSAPGADTKLCPHCLQFLPLENFGRDRSRPDGHMRLCKPCDAAYRRKLAIAKTNRQYAARAAAL